MIVLAIPKEQDILNVLVVLDENAIARFRERQNNFAIDWAVFSGRFPGRTPGKIFIAYATPTEMKKIRELVANGKSNDALKMVTR